MAQSKITLHRRRLTACAGRGLQTLTVLIAVALAIAMVQEITIGVFEISRLRSAARRSPRQAAKPDAADRIVRARKRISTDGAIHLIREIAHRRRDESADTVEVTTVGGEVVYTGFQDRSPHTYLNWAGGSTREPWGLASSSSQKRMSHIDVEFPRMLVIPVISPGARRATESWRYDSDREVFVGFDNRGLLLGVLGADGLAASSEGEPLGRVGFYEGRIPIGRSSPVMLWRTDRGVYEIDPDRRVVNRIWTEKAGAGSLRGWMRQQGASPDADRPIIIVRVDDDTHKLLLRNGDREITITTPESWRENRVEFAMAGGTVFVKRHDNDMPPQPDAKDRQARREWGESIGFQDRHYWLEVHRLEPTGELTRLDRLEWTVPAAPLRWRPRHWARGAICNLSPPVYRWYFQKYEFMFDDGGFLTSVDRFIKAMRPRQPWNWAVCVVLVLLAAWHGWARRTSWPPYVGWLVLVALFAAPGLLTYWAMNHTRLIRCTVCGAKRGLARPACRACGAPLPKGEPTECDRILLPAPDAAA